MASFLPSNTLYATLNESFTLPEKIELWQKVIITREVDTAKILNGKTNGTYSTVPNLSGEQWPGSSNQNNVRTLRKMIHISALPNTTTTNYAHGITTTTTGFFVSKIYGAASDAANHLYIPLPYPSATGASIIEISMNATNIVVTTGSNRSAFAAYIIIEYGIVV
jgi:hypothetical protein